MTAPMLPMVAAVAGSAGQGIDLVAVGLLAVGAVRGGFRGLTGELARVAGFAAALAAGYGVSKAWGGYALMWFPDQAVWRGIVLVVGLVVVATLAGQGTRWLMERFLRLLLDQPADAVFGVLAGCVRAALLVVVLFFIASFAAFGPFGRVLFVDSVAGRVAFPAVQRLRTHVGPLDPSGLVREFAGTPLPAHSPTIPADDHPPRP